MGSRALPRAGFVDDALVFRFGERITPFGESSSGSRVRAAGFRTEGLGVQDVGPRSWNPRVSLSKVRSMSGSPDMCHPFGNLSLYFWINSTVFVYWIVARNLP